jgi:hypothetical protein
VEKTVDGVEIVSTPCVCVGTDPGCSPYPLTLGLAPSTRSDGTFRVRAVGYPDRQCNAKRLVDQSATVQFVREKSLRLDLFLVAACRDAMCSFGQTCRGDATRCVGDEFTSLPEFSPDALALSDDAGADLSPPDLSPPVASAPKPSRQVK